MLFSSAELLPSRRSASPEVYRSLRKAYELEKDNTEVMTALGDLSLMGSSQIQSDPETWDLVTQLSGNLIKKDPKSFSGHRMQGYVALATEKTRKPEPVSKPRIRLGRYNVTWLLHCFRFTIKITIWPKPKNLAGN